MRNRYFSFGLLALSALVAAACGATRAAVGEPRESGQSSLMGKTKAGQRSCNTKDHLRPFVIEWDATDVSSFESRAKTDVIFVRYTDCQLDVVDSCTNDAVRGSLGSYNAPDWTTGSVEKVDIQNEDELYAKLPLGVHTLGARVGLGEKFHMEYFVSGTRKSTRPAIYRGDLDKVPGCKGVTHFVYAYNMGAFALGSLSKVQGQAGATVWGVGAEANSKNQSSIEKQGGVLSSCRGESAHETQTCTVPIRVTLREIEEGASADTKAAVAPETPDALNLAGKLQATTDAERKAIEQLTSAHRKLLAGDGKGCLVDLDAHDKSDARPAGLSTEPKGNGWLRAQCLMASGQCDAGRALAKRSSEAQNPSQSPKVTDDVVDSSIAQHCASKTAAPRDQLLRATFVLGQWATRDRAKPEQCVEAVDRASAAWPKVTPRDADDRLTKDIQRRIAEDGARCLARAGDCAAAWKRYPALHAAWQASEKREPATPEALRSAFVSATSSECIGKDQGPMPPRDELARATQELDFMAGRQDFPVTVASCRALVDRGKKALSSLASDTSDTVKGSAYRLADKGGRCLAKAGDCPGARALAVDMYRSQHPGADAIDRAERHFASSGDDKCRTVMAPGLPAREALAQAARILESPKATQQECQAALDEFQRAAPAAGTDRGVETLKDEAPRTAARCFARVGACARAFQVAKDLNGKRSRPLPTEALVSVVAATDACRLAQVTGLNDEEQYLFAHERLIHAPKAGDAANMCQEQFAIAERTVGKVDKKLTRGFGNAWLRTQCLVRVGACKEARASYVPQSAASTFDQDHSACRGQ
jgi:hypothetical protein